jgi:hypothetical protein
VHDRNDQLKPRFQTLHLHQKLRDSTGFKKPAKPPSDATSLGIDDFPNFGLYAFKPTQDGLRLVQYPWLIYRFFLCDFDDVGYIFEDKSKTRYVGGHLLDFLGRMLHFLADAVDGVGKLNAGGSYASYARDYRKRISHHIGCVTSRAGDRSDLERSPWGAK